MIFQHTIDAVLARQKTQTRRRIHSGDVFSAADPLSVIHANGVVRWLVGKDYAIQRGRTCKAVPRLRLRVIGLRFDREPLKISLKDAIAEGFADQAAFVAAWKALHKKHAADPCWVIHFKVIYQSEAAA